MRNNPLGTGMLCRELPVRLIFLSNRFADVHFNDSTSFPADLSKVYDRSFFERAEADGGGTQGATMIDATQARFIFDASKLTAGLYYFTIITDGVPHTGEFLKVSNK